MPSYALCQKFVRSMSTVGWVLYHLVCCITWRLSLLSTAFTTTRWHDIQHPMLCMRAPLLLLTRACSKSKNLSALRLWFRVLKVNLSWLAPSQPQLGLRQYFPLTQRQLVCVTAVPVWLSPNLMCRLKEIPVWTMPKNSFLTKKGVTVAAAAIAGAFCLRSSIDIQSCKVVTTSHCQVQYTCLRSKNKEHLKDPQSMTGTAGSFW